MQFQISVYCVTPYRYYRYSTGTGNTSLHLAEFPNAQETEQVLSMIHHLQWTNLALPPTVECNTVPRLCVRQN